MRTANRINIALRHGLMVAEEQRTVHIKGDQFYAIHCHPILSSDVTFNQNGHFTVNVLPFR